MLCGDEEGSVWIYDVRHILAQPLPLTTAPQAPIQVSAVPCWDDWGWGWGELTGTQHLSVPSIRSSGGQSPLLLTRWSPRPW